MKKLLIDQALFLVISIVILMCIPLFCGPIISLLFEFSGMLCSGYLCRRILLLPIDLIWGYVSREVYYSSQCGIEDLEFFRNTNYPVWKFCLGNNQTLTLLVPASFRLDEINTITFPPKKKKIRITYFRFSKILLKWDLVLYSDAS